MKYSSKNAQYLLPAVLSLLFLLTAAVMLVSSGNQIRQLVLYDIDREYRTMYDALNEISDTDYPNIESIYAAYQAAMVNNDAQSDAAYSYCSGSCIVSGTTMQCRSRNVLLCRFIDEAGAITSVPVAFPNEEENTSYAGELLFQREISMNVTSYRYSKITLSGNWVDGVFYLKSLDSPDFVYVADESSTLPTPTGSFSAIDTTTYIAQRSVSSPVYLYSDPIVKNYGSDSYLSTDFISHWKDTDALIQGLYVDYVNAGVGDTSPPRHSGSLVDGGLWRTTVTYSDVITDTHGVYDDVPSKSHALYRASFSPMALSFRENLLGGSFFLLLLFYLVCWLLLHWYFSEARRQELRGYQDEISRQAQALRYAQDAERSRREMTSAIAHEMKTPIAVLNSYAEALQENIDPSKEQHYLTVIRDEAAAMDRMVLELLDYSRLESGKYRLNRERFDLKELVQEIITPLQAGIEQKSLQINWQVGDTMVTADRYRFGQVVQNYLTNAIRHTPEGGTIILRIGMNQESFSVENEGRQIPADQLSKVWETFWQGDTSRTGRGSGLGLAICRSVMALHGGSCRVENTATGVRFTADLSQSNSVFLHRTMPQEQYTDLIYPIAQEYTTVLNVMLRLGLMDRISLYREIQAGNLHCGSSTVHSMNDRLYPGYSLMWRDFRITISVNVGEKRTAMLTEGFRAGSLFDRSIFSRRI